jgi:hypothetical protein
MSNNKDLENLLNIINEKDREKHYLDSIIELNKKKE